MRNALSIAALCVIIAVISINAGMRYQIANAPVEAKQSIAVLPFPALSSEDNARYFADGIVSELTQQLSVHPSLRIIAKSSSSVFRNEQSNTQTIADKLDADYLVLGSVLQKDASLQVYVQLIDTASKKMMLSEKFEASTDTVFDMHKHIHERIIDSLGVPSASRISSQYSRSSSTDAYVHWLKGRKYNQIRTPELLLSAREQLSAAVQIDPHFAEAYVDLGVTYLLLGSRSIIPAEQALPEAHNAISKALRIKPGLSSAHAALGVLAQTENRIQEAKVQFERALDADANNYMALINYARILNTHFDQNEALKYYRVLLNSDPLSSDAFRAIGRILIAKGEFDQAIENYQSCVYRIPHDTDCKYGLAYTARLLGYNQAADRLFAETFSQRQDYFHRTAFGWHSLWDGELERANQIYDKLVAQFGFDTNALQSINLAKLAVGEEQSWYQQISEAFNSGANRSLSVAANYANAAFFNEQCDVAILMYERVLEAAPQLFDNLENLANGVTYYAMLAHCYRQLSDEFRFADTLNKLESLLISLPENSNFVGGFQYGWAQFYALNNDIDSLHKTLALLRDENWTLYWLINKNPIFSGMVLLETAQHFAEFKKNY